MLLFVIFFVFKQKTAYELLISAWSSEVCSSDLQDARLASGLQLGELALALLRRLLGRWIAACSGFHRHPALAFEDRSSKISRQRWAEFGRITVRRGQSIQRVGRWPRSEEHTSELQSLMRISYAVFCLKKKKQNTRESKTYIRHTQTHT